MIYQRFLFPRFSLALCWLMIYEILIDKHSELLDKKSWESEDLLSPHTKLTESKKLKRHERFFENKHGNVCFLETILENAQADDFGIRIHAALRNLSVVDYYTE